MTSSPDEPITDPTEFPDSGPDIDPAPGTDEPQEQGNKLAYNPFAAGQPFAPGNNPRDDPQSQASL